MRKLTPLTCLLIVSILIAPAPTEGAAVNISIPYTSQAPLGNWSQPWQDACEEAVTVMIDNYYRGRKTPMLSVAEGASQIRQVINLENKFFGFSKDTNATQITELINNFYNWEAFAVSEPTIEQITAEVDNGRPVIATVYGKGLKNPYFRRRGPDYHTVIIKGYDNSRQEFITHEPGMNRGLDYRYSYVTIMDALHDFVPGGRTVTGAPVAVFTRPDVSDSGYTDGDLDGLSKADELRYGTSLWLKDSDGDGYTDGAEAKAGYSPAFDERHLPDGTLVKAVSDPTIYLLEYGRKNEIYSEEAFYAHGWKWSKVKIVGQNFLDSLEDGYVVYF